MSSTKSNPAGSPSTSAAARRKKKRRKKAANRLADARARMYHELIFESAEVVFGAHGYDGATMQEIADEAGVSLKTVYATYENKQSLYEQIMRQRARHIVEAMEAVLDFKLKPLDQLAAIVAAYVEFILDHPDWLRIHLRGRVAWAFRPTDEVVAESWSRAREIHTRIVRSGMATGAFFEGDAEEVAILVQSIMQVQIARAMQDRKKDATEIESSIMLYLRRVLCPR